MVSEALAQLLVLHDRDRRVTQVRSQLEQWPQELQGIEREIAAERQRVLDAEAAVRALEVQRKEAEGRVADAEERAVKYQTQQLQVKKQEEYVALEQEVASLKSSIDDWETEILDLLEQLEQAQEKLRNTRTDAAEQIALMEKRIEGVNEALERNRAEVGDAEAALEEARAAVADPRSLQEYEHVRRQVKRFPLIVPLIDGKCEGCHLKVPMDVNSEARRGTEIIHCSSCSRIVYIE